MHFFDEGNLFRGLVKWASACLLACASVFAEDTTTSTISLPAWWTAEGTRIIDPAATPNNYAPVNIGQLKNVALMAIGHFESVLGESQLGEELTDLKTTLLASAANAQINNKAPANLGQAKAIMKPFYNRMAEMGLDPFFYLYNVGYPFDWPSFYPFKLPPERGETDTPARAIFDKWVLENYKPINIGQLKASFSFDLNNIPGGTSDIPLRWILENFGSLSGFSPDGDADGDGLTNRQEYAQKTTPNNADTDGDGLADGWEVQNGFDPLVPNQNSVGGVSLQELSQNGEGLTLDVFPPAPNCQITVVDKSLEKIELQWDVYYEPDWGESRPELPTKWILFRNGIPIGTFPGSTLSYVDDQIETLLPEDDGITLEYSIAGVNQAGILGQLGIVSVRIGDFVEAELSILKKHWYADASGGYKGFLPADGERYNYYNVYDSTHTYEKMDVARYSSSWREDWWYTSYDGTSYTGYGSINSSSSHEYNDKSDSSTHCEFKAGGGTWRGNSSTHGGWRRSESEELNSDFPPITTSTFSNVDPIVSSFSSTVSGPGSISLTGTVSMGENYVRVVSRSDTNPNETTTEDEDSGTEESENAGRSWSDYSSSFTRINSEEIVSATFSSLITPQTRIDWCEEMMMTLPDENGKIHPGFGDSKTCKIQKTPTFTTGITGGTSAAARRFANYKNGFVEKSIFRYRISGQIEKHNRYYAAFIKKFIPYDGDGNLLRDLMEVECERLNLSKEFVASCAASADFYSEEEIKWEPREQYGYSEMSFEGYPRVEASVESVIEASLNSSAEEASSASRMAVASTTVSEVYPELGGDSGLKLSIIIPSEWDNTKWESISIAKIGGDADFFFYATENYGIDKKVSWQNGTTSVMIGPFERIRVSDSSSVEFYNNYSYNYSLTDEYIHLYPKKPGWVKLRIECHLSTGGNPLVKEVSTYLAPAVDFGADFNNDGAFEYVSEAVYDNIVGRYKFKNRSAENCWPVRSSFKYPNGYRVWTTKASSMQSSSPLALVNRHLVRFKLQNAKDLLNKISEDDNGSYVCYLYSPIPRSSMEFFPGGMMFQSPSWNAFKMLNADAAKRTDLLTPQAEIEQIAESRIPWEDGCYTRIPRSLLKVEGEDLMLDLLMEVSENLGTQTVPLRVVLAPKDSRWIKDSSAGFHGVLVPISCRELVEVYQSTTSGGPGTLTATLFEKSSQYGTFDDSDPAGNDTTGTKDLLLFVHGFNNSPQDKDSRIQEIFKRLYYSGYKGKVVAAFWDCDWWMNYASSEYKAFTSGEALKGLLSKLGDRNCRLHVMAHSQGNVVVAEAFRKWAAGNAKPLLDTYIAVEAAIPAGIYDSTCGTLGLSRYDLFQHYPDGIQGLPYMVAIENNKMNSIHNVARYWMSYYNEDDETLLLTWVGYQMSKPKVNFQFPSGTKYTYINDAGHLYLRKQRFCEDTRLIIPNDNYELFSLCVTSLTKALGVYDRVVEPFDVAIELKMAPSQFGHGELFETLSFGQTTSFWNSLVIYFKTLQK